MIRKIKQIHIKALLSVCFTVVFFGCSSGTDVNTDISIQNQDFNESISPDKWIKKIDDSINQITVSVDIQEKENIERNIANDISKTLLVVGNDKKTDTEESPDAASYQTYTESLP